jgi:hypothetical protein
MVFTPGMASAQKGKCSNAITACGCTIAAEGNYVVESPLSASQGLTAKKGCIDISASNITLDVYYPITGPDYYGDCGYTPPPSSGKTAKVKAGAYTGVGIHVLPGSNNAAINFNGEDYGTCGWNYGAESEGTNARWNLIPGYDNNVGMLFLNATGSSCTSCFFEDNFTGLEIAGGSQNTVAGSYSIGNEQYGYWLNGTQENTISYNNLYTNGIAGLYLGCSAKGNVNAPIPCTVPTSENEVVQTILVENNKYGIATEKGGIGNRYLDNQSGYAGKYDIIDGNGNCVYNQYLDNTYIKKLPKCIQ